MDKRKKQNTIIKEEIKLINVLMEEWKLTINTQMHFNDLILRFRSIVLSVFITTLGIIYGLGESIIKDASINKIYFLPVVFWFSCFIIDFFYYQKLLIGSVDYANKFSDLEISKKQNVFGLTKAINKKVNRNLSSTLILLFYLFPLLTLIIISLIN